MEIERVEVFPVRLAMHNPFTTSSGSINERELAVLRLTDAAGNSGLGEITPYPGPGEPDLTEFLVEFDSKVASKLASFSNLEESEWRLPTISPPVLCAIDTALLDLRARRAGVRAAELLGEEVAVAVPVNATITAEEPERVAALAVDAQNDGYSTVKLKVGFSDRDEERLAALRDAVGFEMLVRLDANGAWSREQAQSMIPVLQQYGLELIEQPVAPDDLDAMGTLRATASVPIVADEGVRTPADLERHVAAGACDGIVIKLSQAGGPTAAVQLADHARDEGLLVVVTGTLDGPIGLAATLHFAAAYADYGLACGLGTEETFERTYAVGLPPVVDGCMNLGEGPGLGIDLEMDALAELAPQ